MTSPRVSVLMPVYNGERFLREAVESILGQTFTDFEFIIVDDGSTDGTKAILDSYTDPRIVRLTNGTNEGVVASLNRGLEAARGTYVARMDADDISLPDRLETQIQYLEMHPDIGILGTGTILIDQQGRALAPLSSEEGPHISTPGVVHWRLFFHCPIAHPTVLSRRSLLGRLEGYDPQFKHAEDYELWLRASAFTRIASIPAPLVKLRLHSNKISHLHSQIQQHKSDVAVQQILVSALRREISLEDASALRNWRHIVSSQQAAKVAGLLADLYLGYSRSSQLDENEQRFIQGDIGLRLADIAVVGLKYDRRIVGRLAIMALRLPVHSQMQCFWMVVRRSVRSALNRAVVRCRKLRNTFKQ